MGQGRDGYWVGTTENHEITQVTEAMIFGIAMNTVIFAKCRDFAMIFRVFLHECLIFIQYKLQFILRLQHKRNHLVGIYCCTFHVLC